jgi:hypothetical protein
MTNVKNCNDKLKSQTNKLNQQKETVLISLTVFTTPTLLLYLPKYKMALNPRRPPSFQ